MKNIVYGETTYDELFDIVDSLDEQLSEKIELLSEINDILCDFEVTPESALVEISKLLSSQDNYDEEYDEDEDPWDDYDWCYECTGYGDDYHYDENGELVSSCDDCPNNPNLGD